MTQGPDADEKSSLAATFNRLSWRMRTEIRASALAKMSTGIFRDDTKAHPWRYPFYAGYIGFTVACIPLPGPNIIPLVPAALLMAVASLQLTPWSRWVHGRVKETFNAEALMRDHRQFVTPDPGAPGCYKIDNSGLLKDMTRTAWRDSRQATSHAWNGLRRALHL